MTTTGEGDSSRVETLLGTLSHQIDGVEAALQPLLSKPLSATTSKVPLLDKAKIYVHTAYAVESLVFSYLNLNGVETKSHPVFNELKRTRGYFEKVKSAESEGPQSKLDKGAANRFIKHALSGNEEYVRKRAEAQQAQQAGAKRKLDALADRYGTDNRFGAMSKKVKEDENGGKQTLVGKAASESKAIATKQVFDDKEEEATTRANGKDAEQPPSEDRDAGATKTSKKDKKKSQRDAHGSKDSVADHWHSKSEGAVDKRSRKKKLSHAPKDAHQAFQSLLGKSGEASQDRSAGDGSKKSKKHKDGGS
ncbi:Exosome complex protein [Elsinoe australis]|uniref:Exosome complex protein n=1 Tax=Elsinoe australis TaxID=40998 RepID=A0A2P7YG38_9PEZI|nr:Exosome complex protein [Elsinoe australis]